MKMFRKYVRKSPIWILVKHESFVKGLGFRFLKNCERFFKGSKFFLSSISLIYPTIFIQLLSFFKQNICIINMYFHFLSAYCIYFKIKLYSDKVLEIKQGVQNSKSSR